MRIIGLMSGTSLDGVDGVLADFSDSTPRVLAHSHLPYDRHLREELLQLNQAGADEIHRGALAANAVSRAYAAVVASVLSNADMDRDQVRVLGAHGQHPCDQARVLLSELRRKPEAPPEFKLCHYNRLASA